MKEVQLFQLLQSQIYEFWHIYLIRVDPLTKLLHYHSFSDQVVQLAQQSQPLELDIHALLFSVFLAAVNSLSNDEAILRLKERGDVLRTRFTKGMQAALGRAEARRQPTTRVLQAVTLYVVSVRMFWELVDFSDRLIGAARFVYTGRKVLTNRCS